MRMLFSSFADAAHRGRYLVGYLGAVTLPFTCRDRMIVFT
jgi:hypothetical protein